MRVYQRYAYERFVPVYDACFGFVEGMGERKESDDEEKEMSDGEG